MTAMKMTTVPVKAVVMRRMKTITLTGDRDELSYVIFVLINDEEVVERPAITNLGRANNRTVIVWLVF